MFFKGSLQEGIGAAVQQQKRVVCFVTDDSALGKTWENDYLIPLAGPLGDHAIVLKIAKDSQEEGFLSAIAPVGEAPTVVVISNGQVKEALAPPLSIDEFRKKILTAMDLKFSISQPQGQARASESDQAEGAGAQNPQSTSEETQESVPAEPSWLAERRQRMRQIEIQREAQKKEEAEAARQAAQKPGSKAAYHAKLKEEARKRQKAQTDERQRILRNIEDDRRERRRAAEERAEERAKERQQSTEESAYVTQAEDGVASDAQHQQRKQASTSAADASQGSERTTRQTKLPETVSGNGGGSSSPSKCRLQLRFPGGQVERAEFSSLDTLETVKSWVVKEGFVTGRGAFGFRRVIGTGVAPQIGREEEAKTLKELELAPSATLVVRQTSSARRGFTGPLFRPILAVLQWFWALVFTIIAIFQRSFQRPSTASATEQRTMDHDSVGRATGAQARSTDLQGLEERKKHDKPSFYNGNQTSVLPNDDTEDDKSK